MTDYEGKILISTNHVNSKIFANSVIYIHTDDDTGTIGVMVNKPMSYDQALSWSKEIDWNWPERIYHGGPVERHLGYVVHTNDYMRVEMTVPLNGDISYTGGRGIVDDLNVGDGPEKFILLTGYCQWQPKQLQNEIDHKMWMPVEFNVDYLFQDLPRVRGWEYAVNLAAQELTRKLLITIDTNQV